MDSTKNNQSITSLSDELLRSLCRKLGITKSSRKEMIKKIESLIIPNNRSRRISCLEQKNLRKKSKKRSPRTKYLKLNKENYILSEKTKCIHRQIQSAIKIQRFWRKFYIPYVNDIDFLTLEKIKVSPFRLIENNNHAYRFHPSHLAQYFMKEGKFINPYTRRELNEVELKRLDKTLRNCDEKFVSFYQEHERIKLMRAQEREHINTCALLHAESLKIFTELVDVINNTLVHEGLSTAIFELIQVLIPKYFHNFRQLYILDYAYAMDSMFYVYTTIKKFKKSILISDKKESFHIIKTAEHILTKFYEELLPWMEFISPTILNNYEDELNDLNGSNNLNLDINNLFNIPPLEPR